MKLLTEMRSNRLHIKDLEVKDMFDKTINTIKEKLRTSYTELPTVVENVEKKWDEVNPKKFTMTEVKKSPSFIIASLSGVGMGILLGLIVGIQTELPGLLVSLLLILGINLGFRAVETDLSLKDKSKQSKAVHTLQVFEMLSLTITVINFRMV